MVAARAAAGKNYGVVLVPEGLIECVPEVSHHAGVTCQNHVPSNVHRCACGCNTFQAVVAANTSGLGCSDKGLAALSMSLLAVWELSTLKCRSHRWVCFPKS